MPRHAWLVAVTLLLAGCASGDHAGHGGAGEGPRLLAGVQNDGAETVDVELRLLAPDGSLAWSANLTVAAGKTVERATPLNATGEHHLELRRAGDGMPLGTATVDPADCSGTMHVVLLLAGDGATRETTRECHE